MIVSPGTVSSATVTPAVTDSAAHSRRGVLAVSVDFRYCSYSYLLTLLNADVVRL